MALAEVPVMSAVQVQGNMTERFCVHHTIDPEQDNDAPRGHIEFDQMGYHVSIVWEGRLTPGGFYDRSYFFTIKVSDKYHSSGDVLQLRFHTEAIDEQPLPDSTTAISSWNLRSPYLLTAPLQINLQFTKTGHFNEDRFMLKDENLLRTKKILANLYESLPNTGDVTIDAMNETQYKAHKVILQSQSPVFKAMLDTNMKERQESKIKMETFEIQLVAGMIEFMYLGWTDVIRLAPEGLVRISHMYQLLELLEVCWNEVMKSLKIENCVNLLLLADKYDDQEGTYKKKIGRFILDNFWDVRRTSGYEVLVRDHTDLYLELRQFE